MPPRSDGSMASLTHLAQVPLQHSVAHTSPPPSSPARLACPIPSLSSLLSFSAFIALATPSLCASYAPDCAPWESIYAQSGITPPWTLGDCCAVATDTITPDFECDANGRVNRALLSGLGLSGPLPDFSGRLANLDLLDLSGNKFTGTLPNMTGLTSLNDIRLDGNTLLGLVDGLLPFTLTHCQLAQSTAGLFTCGGAVPSSCLAEASAIQVGSSGACADALGLLATALAVTNGTTNTSASSKATPIAISTPSPAAPTPPANPTMATTAKPSLTFTSRVSLTAFAASSPSTDPSTPDANVNAKDTAPSTTGGTTPLVIGLAALGFVALVGIVAVAWVRWGRRRTERRDLERRGSMKAYRGSVASIPGLGVEREGITRARSPSPAAVGMRMMASLEDMGVASPDRARTIG